MNDTATELLVSVGLVVPKTIADNKEKRQSAPEIETLWYHFSNKKALNSILHIREKFSDKQEYIYLNFGYEEGVLL